MLDAEYVEKLVTAELRTLLKDILVCKNSMSNSEKYWRVKSTLEYFRKDFNIDLPKVKAAAMQILKSFHCQSHLFYWYMREGNAKAGFSLMQRDAIELTEHIKRAVDNPFLYSKYKKKELSKVVACIERLVDLMEVMEKEVESSNYLPSSELIKKPKGSPLKPSLGNFEFKANKKSKATAQISKKDIKESCFMGNNVIESANKMKTQIAFSIYVGLIMILCNCNKYYRSAVLVTQLSGLLSSSFAGWKTNKLENCIAKLKKTIDKCEELNEVETMKLPCRTSKEKGEEFFSLWFREVALKRLALAIKVHQAIFKANFDNSAFRSKPAATNFYEHKSSSVFQ